MLGQINNKEAAEDLLEIGISAYVLSKAGNKDQAKIKLFAENLGVTFDENKVKKIVDSLKK